MKRSNDFNIFFEIEEDEFTNNRCKKDKLNIVLEKLSNVEAKINNQFIILING
ncbi:hypothetical protein CVS40_9277 [Lucilia cuprina]|nr:hypothetical protein CVS40_9277 [Lucilia cuprina]